MNFIMHPVHQNQVKKYIPLFRLLLISLQGNTNIYKYDISDC